MLFESHYLKSIVTQGDYKLAIIEGFDDRYVVLKGNEVIAFLEGQPPYTDVIFIHDSFSVDQIFDIFEQLYLEYCKGFQEDELKKVKKNLKEARDYKFNLIKV